MLNAALRKRLAFGLITFLGLGLLFSLAISRQWLAATALSLTNGLYRGQGNETLPDIVIVTIDDASLQRRQSSELGTLRFAKVDYAKVLTNLEAAGAQAIGVDVILSESSTDQDEQVLAEVLRNNPNVVLASDAGLSPRPRFVEAAGALGAITYQPDIDNVVRRQRAFFIDIQRTHAFAVEIVRAFLGAPRSDVEITDDGLLVISRQPTRINSQVWPAVQIPLRGDDPTLIRFFGRPNSFTTISFADALDNKLPDLQGKIILIGEMGTALHDEQYVPTSFGRPMPGVEIHAHFIQTMLTGRYLHDWTQATTLILVWLALALSFLLFLTLRIRLTLLSFLVLGLGYIVAAWAAFSYGAMWDLLYVPLAIITAFIAAMTYRYVYEQRKTRDLRRAFSQYVNPHVVQTILQEPDSLKLGGEKKELTVFFSDIAGFTTISESLPPEVLVEQLNEYFDAMGEAVLQYDGTIDKYIGDAVMAFWGAPIADDQHAVKACYAALQYQKRLAELNAQFARQHRPVFKARIGLNTGAMVVGNIGSQHRFNYTVIGDPVNLGARLEGANKYYGTLILLSEYTYALAKEAIEAREVDLLTVKGKTKPVRIYELVAKKGEATQQQQQVLELFAKGLAKYREQKWDDAIGYFTKVLLVDAQDGPSKMYIDRCASLRLTKLRVDWDGVYELHEK